MSYTKTPWEQDRTFSCLYINGNPHAAWEIVSPSEQTGVALCILPHEDLTADTKTIVSENARLIVRAVNAFEPMRKALEGLLARHRDGSDESHWAEWDAAEEVLALADKDQP